MAMQIKKRKQGRGDTTNNTSMMQPNDSTPQLLLSATEQQH
jgi:hypothetical protein